MEEGRDRRMRLFMRVEGTDFREERMEQPERVFPNHQIKFHELKFNLSEKKKKKLGKIWRNVEYRGKIQINKSTKIAIRQPSLKRLSFLSSFPRGKLWIKPERLPSDTSLASLVNRQWARENCQREIFPLVAEERKRERHARSLNSQYFFETHPSARAQLVALYEHVTARWNSYLFRRTVETGHGCESVDEKERERERDRETGGKGKKKRIKEIKGGEKRREGKGGGLDSVERKLEGRGKKGRVFTGPEEFIYTRTRARVCKIENGKRGQRERGRGREREEGKRTASKAGIGQVLGSCG